MNDYKLLISPEELSTFYNLVSLNDIMAVSDIQKAYKGIGDKFNIQISINDLFGYNCMLATIWNAGRVQGIREERKRRHNKATA